MIPTTSTKQKQPQFPISHFSSKKTLVNLTIGKKYFISQKITQNQFGQLYKCINLQNKLTYTLNLLYIQSLTPQTLHQLQRKLKIFSNNEQPNILPIYQVYRNQQYCIVITKYCPYGSLAHQLSKYHSFSITESINALNQLSRGILALHKNQQIYGYLNPYCIMLDDNQYMIDCFGFDKIMFSPKQIIKCSAPQILSKRQYDASADFYSLGIIFYMMLYPKGTLSQRFSSAKSKDFTKIQQKIKKQQKNNSSLILHFLQKSLQQNPQSRITQSQLMSHPIYTIYQPVDFSQYKSTKSDSIYIKIQKSTFFTNSLIKSGFPVQQQNSQYHLQFQQLPKQQITIITKSINKQKQLQQQQYQLLLYKKLAQYILNRLILPIEKNKLLNFNSKSTIQIMYLLSVRSFMYISYINNKQKQNQQYKIHDKQLYLKIKSKFQQYSTLLTNFQNKFMQKFINIVSIFKNKSQQQNKNRMYNGLLDIDYTSTQHLNFMQTTLNTIKQFTTSNQQLNLQMLSICKSFTTINSIQSTQLKSTKFQTLIYSLHSSIN